MSLTLILGPMKSGKSFDLISFFSPLRYSTSLYGLYQSARNVRDGGVQSRSGLSLEATKIASLSEIPNKGLSIVGIDEAHMFEPEDAVYIGKLLSNGTSVVISALDTDYRGELFAIVKRLFELGPTEVRYKRAVCDGCKEFLATYTQVYDKGVPITEGMPQSLPDDGTFTYAPLCRTCFIRP